MNGYCPKCGLAVSGVSLTTAGRGVCEIHGWVYCDWSPPAGQVMLDTDDQPVRIGSVLENGGTVIGLGDEDGPVVIVQHDGHAVEWAASPVEPRDAETGPWKCDAIRVQS